MEPDINVGYKEYDAASNLLKMLADIGLESAIIKWYTAVDHVDDYMYRMGIWPEDY